MTKYIYILIFLVFFAFLGEYIYNVSPYELNPNAILQEPSIEHLFGTDRLGRDILARIIQGLKVSLIIGFFSSLIATLIGIIVGVSSGFFKGIVDKITIILIDLFLTFPTFFLLLALVSYIDSSVFVLIFIISITSWMSLARIIRSQSFEIANKPYIDILTIANVSKVKIIFKYFLPILYPIIANSFIFGLSGAILAESSLSFLGLGINPPMVSLGAMLNSGKDVLDIAWWVSFFPGLFIFLITFSLVSISNKIQSNL